MRDDLLSRAARIDEPALRESFLKSLSANARTLTLARAWLGEHSSPARRLPS
ncbi:hypothetical protein [Sorangium sp. So ce1000]|uniref:hypothetical protein n=1 Tax=Sorangium sp. So ce1000 TaxID=3133325 RepID=UPI003F5EF657